MASFTREATIEFEVICDECGSSLGSSEKEIGHYDPRLELSVELCENCKEKLEDLIKEKEEQISDMEEEHEKEIKRLNDEIEALQTELTFNKLKNNEKKELT